MPRSNDDPHAADVEAVERARVARIRQEAEDKAARARHSAHDDSDPPPPIESPWKRITGVGSPSATIDPDPLVRAERHVRWLSVIKVVVLPLLGGLWALSNWYIDKKIDDAIAKAKREWTFDRAEPSTSKEPMKLEDIAKAASAAVSVAAPLPYRISEIEKKQAKDGHRWDKLDKAHTKWFQRPGQPKLPKFGPKAEARGEAVTFDDLEEP